MMLRDTRLARVEDGPWYAVEYVPVPVRFVGPVILKPDKKREEDRRFIRLVNDRLMYSLAYLGPDGLREIHLDGEKNIQD